VAHSVEWARQLKDQLEDEIRLLRARAREGVQSADMLGFAPDQDHLEDLMRRSAQVDRLIEAMADTEAAPETGWPANLGDPSADEDPGGRPGVPSR
jgi:hypothetical protein